MLLISWKGKRNTNTTAIELTFSTYYNITYCFFVDEVLSIPFLVTMLNSVCYHWDFRVRYINIYSLLESFFVSYTWYLNNSKWLKSFFSSGLVDNFASLRTVICEIYHSYHEITCVLTFLLIEPGLLILILYQLVHLDLPVPQPFK